MGYVYDIEIFPNLLLIVFKSIHTGEISVVEKSVRRDNTRHLKELVSNNLLIGYNNHEYDDIIINNILANPRITNKELYILSSNIVNRRRYKKLKTKSYTSIDMMKMLFSKALRVSLKELQVSMMWYNVLESSVPFDQPVALDIVDKEVFPYCLNDVESTYHLFNLKKDDIKLRLNIKDKYGIDCLSDDPVRIGVDILTERIIADSPGDKEKNRASFNSIRNIVNEVPLKDVINYDIISFELPQLIDLVEQIKDFTVIPKKKYFEAEVKIGDTIFSVGSGGLHAVINNLIIEPKDDEIYASVDCASYYPSQIVELNYDHKFLGQKFIKEYSDIRTQRFEAKKNKDKITDGSLKLVLNSLYG